MAFITVSDETQKKEIVVFPNEYKKYNKSLVRENILECILDTQNRNNQLSSVLKNVIKIRGKYA